MREIRGVCSCRGAPRLFTSGAVSAFKSEKLQGGIHGSSEHKEDQEGHSPNQRRAELRGPILSQDTVWRNDGASLCGGVFGENTTTAVAAAAAMAASPQVYDHATRPGLQSHLQLSQGTVQRPPAVSVPHPIRTTQVCHSFTLPSVEDCVMDFLLFTGTCVVSVI